MVQATTPTFILTLPNDVDLSIANDVWFTMLQGCTCIQKHGEELDIAANVVSVYLAQEETLKLTKGNASIQLNWVYANGERACSVIKTIPVTENLLKEVIA